MPSRIEWLKTCQITIWWLLTHKDTKGPGPDETSAHHHIQDDDLSTWHTKLRS